MKLVNLLVGGLECLSSHQFPILVVLRPLSYCASFCLSLFLGFSSQASSASFVFMYLVAQYSTFNMVFKLFLYKENKNFLFRRPLVNAATSILSSASFIEMCYVGPQWLVFSLLDTHQARSRFLILMPPPMKCNANCALSSLKVPMELGVNLLHHTLSGPFSVVGKAWHMISSATPCKCIRVLSDSRWSKGSFDSS